MKKLFFTLLSSLLIASCISAQEYTVKFSEDFFTYDSYAGQIDINIPGYFRWIPDEENADETWCEYGMADYTFVNIYTKPKDEFDLGFYTLPVYVYRVKIDPDYVLDKFSARIKDSKVIKRNIRVEGMMLPNCSNLSENATPLLDEDGEFPTQKPVKYAGCKGDELIFYFCPFKYNSVMKTLKFISKIELDVTLKYGADCDVFVNAETVRVNIDSDLQQTLVVLDSGGKQVLTTEFYRTTEFDKNSFNPGVYIFKIVCSNGTVVRKVVL